MVCGEVLVEPIVVFEAVHLHPSVRQVLPTRQNPHRSSALCPWGQPMSDGNATDTLRVRIGLRWRHQQANTETQAEAC